MDSELTGLSTRQFLGVLRRRASWILLCLIVGTVAAYGYSKHEIKKYTATAAVAFDTNPLDQQIAGLTTGNNGASLLAQQTGNLERVSLGGAAAKTALTLGHGLTAAKVKSSVSVGGKAESNVATVAATSTSPRLAAAIANSYVNAFVVEQQKSNREFLKSALALVKRQLAALPLAQRVGPDGLDLQNRAHTLSLLASLGYNKAEVAQEALVPFSPSSPRTKRNTILGAIGGLLIGLALASLLDRLDRRIRVPEDFEEIYGLPMLGVVPRSTAFSRSVRKDGDRMVGLPPAEAEAFNLVRAHLRFFNVDRDVRTLVIASPAPGDGKTLIARHLAEAAARAGSRVLLLEVDLRRPTLVQQLPIQPRPGLADVLIGAVPLNEATQTIELQTPPGEWIATRTLDVLVAGATPPNPSELLESRAMSTVLERVRATYDFVVIDTPPLTAVSDAFPLLTKVDGVVIVGRVAHSRRDEAQRLQQILAGSGAPLLGVIANGSKASGLGSYAETGGGKASSPGASVEGVASTQDLAGSRRE